jgi:hypothetical protein
MEIRAFQGPASSKFSAFKHFFVFLKEAKNLRFF